MTSALNSHPLFIHFPIAFWFGALLFWCLSIWHGNDELFRFGRWLVYVGTLGAVAAVASGFQATTEMGHDAPGHNPVLSLLAITVAVNTLGADRGGMLVFRYDIGTRGDTPPAVSHSDHHDEGHAQGAKTHR